MSANEELSELVRTLSEYESEHLLNLVKNTVEGRRYWEGDIGTFYNEYVKGRLVNLNRNPEGLVPATFELDSGIFAPIPLIKGYPGAPRIELPAPQEIDAMLSETLQKRRSRRDFSGEPTPLRTLSTLLHYGCGTTEFVDAYDFSRFPLRTFPSAGGLQSPEVYVAAHRVDGLLAGLYHYRFLDHALEQLKPGDQSILLQNVALGQPWVAEASLIILVTGCYERLRWKYNERAYRFMCMDIGFLAENLYLVADALQMGTCAIAGFVDDVLELLLGIDGQQETVLLMMCVGGIKQNEVAGEG
jgi:SagB-type dehydrogenase family enzyme